MIGRPRTKIIIGKKYGYLKVISEIGSRNKTIMWLCKCSCGKLTKVTSGHLFHGHTKSCGCLHGKVMKERFTTHGMTSERFYKIYNGIKYRCGRFRNYENIKCLWKSFDEFKKDMYKSYLKHVKSFGEYQTTIDRIDGKKGYYKENCRWATFKKQGQNRKTNMFITFNNKTLILSEWAEIYKIQIYTLRYRIISGWPLLKAFTKPVQ